MILKACSLLTHISLLAALPAGVINSRDTTIDKSSLDSWIKEESDVGLTNLLKNIGNSSVTAYTDLYPGVIVASPSTLDPDYYYQWIRDTALSYRTLINYLKDSSTGTDAEEYQWLIENYIWNSYHVQRIDTRSGDAESGTTLGEPKFLVNNSAFNGDWGRPQNDGPGLRATTILLFIDLGLSYTTGLNDTFIFNEIVQPDLEYVTKYWKNDSFDLWEEIESQHFFTSTAQLKGLLDGLNYINKNKDLDVSESFTNSLNSTYNNLKLFIESTYVNSDVNYVIETPSLYPDTRVGLDAAVLLGAIHGHDSNEYDSYIPFDVDNDRILSHLAALVNDMGSRYSINSNLDLHNAAALGRYPEDVYNGSGTSEGNPWFISTATAAELVYRLIQKLENGLKDVTISSSNKDFYKLVYLFDESQDEVVVTYGSDNFNNLTSSLFEFADSFLTIVMDHVDDYGSISEEFRRDTGYMTGARDLTWSYSSVLNAFRWRDSTKKS